MEHALFLQSTSLFTLMLVLVLVLAPIPLVLLAALLGQPLLQRAGVDASSAQEGLGLLKLQSAHATAWHSVLLVAVAQHSSQRSTQRTLSSFFRLLAGASSSAAAPPAHQNSPIPALFHLHMHSMTVRLTLHQPLGNSTGSTHDSWMSCIRLFSAGSTWPCLLHCRHTVAGCPVAGAAVAIYQQLLVGCACVHAAARGAALPAAVHVLHLPPARVPGASPDQPGHARAQHEHLRAVMPHWHFCQSRYRQAVPAHILVSDISKHLHAS